MAKVLLTQPELTEVLNSLGWKIKRNTKSVIRNERNIEIVSEVPYDASTTKSQQRSHISKMLKAVGAKSSDVSESEWTNEDGGDFNQIRIWMYVPIKG